MDPRGACADGAWLGREMALQGARIEIRGGWRRRGGGGGGDEGMWSPCVFDSMWLALLYYGMNTWRPCEAQD